VEDPDLHSIAHQILRGALLEEKKSGKINQYQGMTIPQYGCVSM
jgi:hypothetical protein